MNRIVIIGGGASGCAAAISASETSDDQVIILERQSRIGRKLLSTGNGRCNLTNIHAAPGGYMSAERGPAADFAAPALRRFGVEDTLEFFHRLGLLTVTEDSGRVYPLSDQANSVVDVLRFALDRPNIKLHAPRPALSVTRKNGKFTVKTQEGNILCDKVIVACGGAAGAKVGGVSDGYAILGTLGHSRTELCPSLTQIKTDPTYPRALKGVKADARVSLTVRGEAIARTGGEVLFTEYGISGPAVFDISRAASTGGRGLCAELDLLREHDESAVYSMLAAKKAAMPGLDAENLFTGMVHNRLGRMLCKYAGISGAAALSSLTDEDIRAAARAAKSFRLPVEGVMGFDSAQVTAGGMRLGEFDPETLESRIVPGVFACGEVLDVDGSCGGFNLQWAWSSGRLAGRTGK